MRLEERVQQISVRGIGLLDPICKLIGGRQPAAEHGWHRTIATNAIQQAPGVQAARDATASLTASTGIPHSIASTSQAWVASLSALPGIRSLVMGYSGVKAHQLAHSAGSSIQSFDSLK